MASVLASSWATIKTSFQCCTMCYKIYKFMKNEEEEEDSNSNQSDPEENSELTTKTKKNAKKKNKSKSSAASKSILSNNTLQSTKIEMNSCQIYNAPLPTLPSLAPFPSQPGDQQTPGSSGNSSEDPEQGIVEWIPSNIKEMYKLLDKAVVGGYDIDETDLWVIRSRFKGEVIPGKLNYFHKLAFAVHLMDGEYKEKNVFEFEVCCADPNRIKWIKCSNGEVPKNAVRAGRRSDETLYVGRAIHNDDQHSGRKSLCPGFIQNSHGVLYVTYNYDFHAHKFYEVMCVE